MTTLADRPKSANEWLWAELERRCGAELAQHIRDGYNERHRRYFKWRRRLGTPLGIGDPLPPGPRKGESVKSFIAAARPTPKRAT